MAKDAECRIPKSEEALRCKKLAYFGIKPPFDKPVLAMDCGNNVSEGAEKTAFGIGIIVRVTI